MGTMRKVFLIFFAIGFFLSYGVNSPRTQVSALSFSLPNLPSLPGAPDAPELPTKPNIPTLPPGPGTPPSASPLPGEPTPTPTAVPTPTPTSPPVGGPTPTPTPITTSTSAPGPTATPAPSGGGGNGGVGGPTQTTEGKVRGLAATSGEGYTELAVMILGLLCSNAGLRLLSLAKKESLV